MALTNGTRLCSYEILGSLGAGGMGEVYRARDTKLGREVAIKVIPEALAQDALRLSRFEREARLLAALNHPNIAAIYGIEDCEGVRFLVLEFVPGLTLADKIAVAPLPLQDALQFAGQIAEGLEAAHEKGIIHRDLKPSNIKVTPEGKVKVLDFGLAKGTDGEATTDEISESPTRTVEGTIQGTVLGTAAYMSPEQARGKPVDRRTDIWSFGCVVYEMLCGKKAFDGETTSDKIAAILGRDPDWEAIPRGTPLSIRELVHRCLQKDLKHRLRDMGDARMEFEELLTERAVTRSKLRLRRRDFLFFGVLAIVMVLVGIWAVRRPPSSPPAQKYLVVLPFKDLSGDQQGQLMADGFGDMVCGQLLKVRGVQVIPPAVVKGLSVPEADLPQLAKVLRANLFLKTSMQRALNQIRVVYSILSTPTGAPGVQIGGGTVEGSAEDVLALEDRFAETVMSELQLQVAGRPARLKPTGFKEAASKISYLKALGYLQRYENETSVDSAIALLKDLSITEPNAALVQAALGSAYLYKYDLTHQSSWADQAIASCKRATELDPQIPEVHVTLGLVQTRTGHAVEGIGEFQRALSEQQNWPDAVLGLAEAYERAKKFSEAEQTYRRAIELQPGYWAGYNKLGNLYKRSGRFPEARDMYQQVVKLSPDNSRGWSNLGVALQQTGRLEEAGTAYKKSVELLPNGDAYSNLGTLEYMLGRYGDAANAYEEAVKLVPKKSVYWANLGDAYRWAPGLHSKATAAYQRAILLAQDELEINPNSTVAHMTVALCRAKIGNCVEAQKHIRQALDQNPNDTDNMFQAAVVANICGRRQEALDWTKKATQLGYSKAAFMEEPELSNLRKDKAFQEALGEKSGPNPPKGP
jgi:tetratricopeptide (TPR) repeat protein/TolB-like protein